MIGWSIVASETTSFLVEDWEFDPCTLVAVAIQVVIGFVFVIIIIIMLYKYNHTY